MIVGVGTASAVFVDYLADRALARAADASPDPGIVAPTSSVAASGKVAGSEVIADAGVDAPVAAGAKPLVEPVAQPVKTEIVAAMPAAEAIAKVAAKVGAEHAIELPTEDPTASPVLHLDDSVETAALEPEGDAEAEALPLNAEDEAADETFTAAIPPDAAEIAPAEPEPKRPSKAKQTAKQPAKVKPEAENTEIAALPGVDIGGLAGNPAPQKATGNSSAVTKTVVKGGARISKAVNLRTRPENGAGVIMVVPAKAAVSVLACDKWCQISYNGKTGWVYKSFITAARPAKTRAEPAADAKQPAATRKIPSSRT